MTQIPLAPLLLSLKVAGLATVATLLLGTPIAWLLARGRFPGRAVLESIMMVPLILPPTVTGYYLLLLVGRHGILGRVLEATFNISLIFTWKAAVLASTIAALPLFIKASQGAFDGIDRRIEDAGRTFKPTLIVLCTIIRLGLGESRVAPVAVRCQMPAGRPPGREALLAGVVAGLLDERRELRARDVR